MPTFTFQSDCSTTLPRLFEAGADGHLRFGGSGISLHPATQADLLAGSVRFRDYLMEGFLTYRVRAESLSSGCLLHVEGEGSNRDRFIGPQVQSFIGAAGLASTVA